MCVMVYTYIAIWTKTVYVAMKEDSNVVNVFIAYLVEECMWTCSVRIFSTLGVGYLEIGDKKCIAISVLEKYTFYQHTQPALYIPGQ